MKTFLAIYLGTASALEKWGKLDEATRKKKEKAGMIGWTNWAKKNKKSIVDDGSLLGKTKRIDAKGISDTKNEMAAYTFVKAKSYEDAAKLFLNHPHFTILPGGSVEIMECIKWPKM